MHYCALFGVRICQLSPALAFSMHGYVKWGGNELTPVNALFRIAYSAK